MEEIKLNMENLTKEEREQLLKLVEKANRKESKVWKPQNGDKYYSIADYGCIFRCIKVDANDCIDESRYAIGNCFKTREEAEFALERQKVIVELERFAKENNTIDNPHWSLWYNMVSDEICARPFGGAITINNYGAAIIPSFTSEELALEAAETIGKERLKKYYFGIKE